MDLAPELARRPCLRASSRRRRRRNLIQVLLGWVRRDVVAERHWLRAREIVDRLRSLGFFASHRSGVGGSVFSSLWPASLVLGLVLFAGTACSRRPAEIRIKGPHDGIEATAKAPVFGPFEKKGESIDLRVSSFDSEGRYLGPRVVEWDVDPRTVATINQTGRLTILSSGDFVVRASTTDLDPPLVTTLPLRAIIEKEVRIVEPKVERESAIDLALGETLSLKAQVLDDRDRIIEGAKVRWNSTSYAATVTPNGEVEGRAIGTTQVVAESRAGHVARLDINVVDWKREERRTKREG